MWFISLEVICLSEERDVDVRSLLGGWSRASLFVGEGDEFVWMIGLWFWIEGGGYVERIALG